MKIVTDVLRRAGIVRDWQECEFAPPSRKTLVAQRERLRQGMPLLLGASLSAPSSMEALQATLRYSAFCHDSLAQAYPRFRKAQMRASLRIPFVRDQSIEEIAAAAVAEDSRVVCGLIAPPQTILWFASDADMVEFKLRNLELFQE